MVLASKAFALQLDLPVACEVGRTCWVQQYVDHDAGAGIADYSCGSASYDGHDGTDFRVLNTTSEVDVLAAADGEIIGLRDGVPDRLLRDEADAKTVQNIECGNGVLMRHADGFETQYCHMRQGSVAVKKGDHVQRGARLGQVGYSGKAAFPHLHFKVQKSAVVQDPFEGEAAADCTRNGEGLWSAAAKVEAVYAASNVLQLGWHERAISLNELEEGQAVAAAPQPQWPALVAAVWLINLQAGDEVRLSVTGPDGFAADNSETLARNKAQYFLFAGKKLRSAAWPKGEYRAKVTVRNGGAVRLESSSSIVME